MASKKPAVPTIQITSTTSLAVLDLATIDERPGINPNTVSDTHFAALVHSIKHNGFLQPFAVRPSDNTEGRFEMVDGHHRLRAAKEAGLTQAPALVVKAESLDAAVAMLSLNRLRGELDLTKVADILQGLSAGGFEDLTLTGFNGGESQALLETSDRGTDGISGLGEDAGADVGPVEVETIAATRHAVRIIFDKAEDLALVRSVALRYGTTIEAGLLTLCKSQQE